MRRKSSPSATPARSTVPLLMLASLSTAAAGPYAPPPGQPGSNAIHRSDTRIKGWASGVASWQPGADVLPQWQDTSKCLGPATDDPTHITCLGTGGTLTLTFPGFIHNGPGADFAVFENGFGDGYVEHAFVEVSRDGVNFVRFPNRSLTAAPVGSFGLLDPTDVFGLGSKYRQPYGEPYDLSDTGLDSISHVRLIDVPGDGSARDSAGGVIYDPWPNEQSAGFDLDAIGVLHLRTWQTLALGSMEPDRVNATAFAHLPDGRFVLGRQQNLLVQTAWGNAALTAIPSGGVEFDPSFLAVRDSSTALLGAGGGFGAGTGLHLFNPDQPAQAVTATPLAELQNYSAVWWPSSVPGRSGWLTGGTNGPQGRHTLTWISADGAHRGPVTAELSTYSSGLAADAAGNVFAALYELSGAEADTVLRFEAAAIAAAVEAVMAGTPAPVPKAQGTPVFRFDTASSLAVDQTGRLWASGFKAPRLQVYDPATGASRRFTPDHDPLPGVTSLTYQVQTFTRGGTGYAAFLATDMAGTPGSAIVHGLAPLSHLPVPETLHTWQAFRFAGAGPLTPENEATLWGAGADPDHDGLPNLLEYALATPPLEKNAPVVAAGQSSGRLTLTFPRHLLRPDVRYTVESSATLAPGSWTALATGANGQPLEAIAPALPRLTETVDPAGSLVTVQLRDAQTLTASARRFLRLRVELLP